MRISDWSSDVCSSDLDRCRFWHREGEVEAGAAIFDLSDRFPVRQDPVQYAFEGILCHLASQTKTISPLPRPRADLCRTFDRIIVVLRDIVRGACCGADGAARQTSLDRLTESAVGKESGK